MSRADWMVSMRTGNSWLACIAILGTLPFTALAETNRPRVALVLEGGGALGFAHIGVIEWLEQNHIPIDYVAGTSMGALVGGIYATGRSPAQIRELVDQIDWGEVLSGQTPFQDLSYRRKEDKIAYPNRLEFGLRGGFNLPGGLNSGHQVGLVLDRAMLPYYDLKTFDDLPIPFRCVATDLIAGKAHIFSNGSLSRALRATMSIPGVFSPVSMNGTMYSDGQAVDNFPVDVGRAMGADIVIGVYLDTGVQDPKAYGSLLGVVGRNLSIMVSANELRGLKTADILINVKLKGFTALDFNRSADIIPLGIQAAAEKRAMLARLSVNDDEWRAYTVLRASRQKTDVPTPEFVAVDGTSPVKVKAIKAQVDHFAETKIDPPQLEAALTKLSGWGYFDSVNYSLTRKQSETGLQIHAEEKAYGPPFLNAGILIDGSDVNDVRFGFSTRLTVMNVGNLRSEWRTDAFFGTTYGVTTEYFRPFNDTTKWFIAPRAYITRNQFDIYNDQSRVAQYFQVRKGGGIDLGYSLGSRAEIRLGEDGAWYDTRRNIGVPLAPDSGLGLGITSLRFQYLGQDDPSVPRKGYTNQSSLQWFSARPDGAGYFSAQTRMNYFKPVSINGSVFGSASGGTTFGASGLELQSFSLGGPLQLGAYGRNELLGNQYFLLQAGYLHQLVRLNILTGGALYGTAFYEVGKVYGGFNLPSLPNDVSFAAIAKTAIGPVYIGGSLGDSSRRKWWFGVGRVF